MNNFWNPNSYGKLISIAFFLIVLGGVISIIEFLTENSDAILISGIIMFLILKIFKSKFH
jgi:hypothetical protein|tara:strand:+ start:1526 stop:1705 length:180 start_codon:yes stop_codon:yes gene_type:complete